MTNGKLIKRIIDAVWCTYAHHDFAKSSKEEYIDRVVEEVRGVNIPRDVFNSLTLPDICGVNWEDVFAPNLRGDADSDVQASPALEDSIKTKKDIINFGVYIANLIAEEVDRKLASESPEDSDDSAVKANTEFTSKSQVTDAETGKKTGELWGVKTETTIPRWSRAEGSCNSVTFEIKDYSTPEDKLRELFLESYKRGKNRIKTDLLVKSAIELGVSDELIRNIKRIAYYGGRKTVNIEKLSLALWNVSYPAREANRLADLRKEG